MFRLLFAANTHCPLSQSVCVPALFVVYNPHAVTSTPLFFPVCVPYACALCPVQVPGHCGPDRHHVHGGLSGHWVRQPPGCAPDAGAMESGHERGGGTPAAGGLHEGAVVQGLPRQLQGTAVPTSRQPPATSSMTSHSNSHSRLHKHSLCLHSHKRAWRLMHSAHACGCFADCLRRGIGRRPWVSSARVHLTSPPHPYASNNPAPSKPPRDSHVPRVSADIITPPLYLTASTEVPVTMGAVVRLEGPNMAVGSFVGTGQKMNNFRCNFTGWNSARGIYGMMLNTTLTQPSHRSSRGGPGTVKRRSAPSTKHRAT